MFRSNSVQYSIRLLLLMGIFFRIFLFYINPPNNSHDNHMEVIHLYAEKFERPGLFDCFECYQPPAYYYIAATVYRLSKSVGLSEMSSWKMVQFINPLLSILTLFLFYFILLEIGLSDKLKLIYLSFLVALPRDIFASSMILNDYLIVFTATAALLFYFRCLRSVEREDLNTSFLNFIILSFFTGLGTVSKQHGLLLLVLPSSVVFIYLFRERKFALTKLMPILLFISTIAFLEELYKYNESGQFLVSNYDHFTNAHNQFPGSIDKVEFFSFRLWGLLQEPFMTENTSASVPSELFARTFFDYEWRFLSPRTSPAIWVGRLAYILGIIWMLFFLGTLIQWIKTKPINRSRISLISFAYVVPVFLGLLYVAVPFLQTIRYPHFSCMKAMFMLPGLVTLLTMHALLAHNLKSLGRYSYLLVALNLIYTTILLIAIYYILEVEISLDNLRGPLWNYPS